MKVQQSLFKSTFLLINAFKNKDTSKLRFEYKYKKFNMNFLYMLILLFNYMETIFKFE